MDWDGSDLLGGDLGSSNREGLIGCSVGQSSSSIEEELRVSLGSGESEER